MDPRLGTTSPALVAIAVAAACAPVATLRPPSALAPGRAVEVGGAAVAVSPRPFVEEPWRGTAQGWAVGPVGERVDLGAVVAFDLDGVAAGVTLRLELIRGARLALALDAELGWAWAAISVPVGVRLADGAWIYAAPRVSSWGPRPALGVAFGASATAADGTFARVEGQLIWPDLSAYQRRLALALGAGRQI